MQCAVVQCGCCVPAVYQCVQCNAVQCKAVWLLCTTVHNVVQCSAVRLLCTTPFSICSYMSGPFASFVFITLTFHVHKNKPYVAC